MSHVRTPLAGAALQSKQTKLLDIIELLDERARKSFRHFMKALAPVDYDIGWVHEEICAELEQFLADVVAGKSPRLMLFLPPRHGKSELASRYFPAYVFGRYPNLDLIATSYGKELASTNNRDVQRIMDSDAFLRLFPRTTLAGPNSIESPVGYTRNSDIFEIVGERGSYKSAGTMGDITGRGMHIGIVDDPIKNAEEAYSQTYRDKMWEWWTSTFYTRLMPGGGILVILTRWHEDDMAGRILAKAKEAGDTSWRVISYPAVAEKDEAHRKEGEALHPLRYPIEALDRIRTAVGSRVWASLFQQRPAAAEGAIFKREWWKTYTPIATDPQELIKELGITHVVQFWDTAFKTKTNDDFSVCVTMGQAENRYYVLDRWKGKVEFPELKREAIAQAAKWMPHTLLIEDAASGQSLIQELQRDSALPVHPIKVDKDKVSRAYAVTPLLEAGRVSYPINAPWASDFIDVLATFPNAEHDDDVDAFDGALEYLARGGGNLGMLDWLRGEILEAERLRNPVAS